MKTGTFETTASGVSYPLHYKIWGADNPPSKTIACVHGLTRNSQEFKFVGEYLASLGYRVAALDIAGRGQSSYYANPDDYNFEQYLKDISLFLKEIGCDQPASCDWLGVSMGGLLGMCIAGGAEASPIRRLILVDVGPEVPQFDMAFLAKFIRLTPEYNSPAENVPFLKMTLGTPYSCGEMTEDQWLYMSTVNLRKNDSEKYIRNFDPNIAHTFDTSMNAVDFWPFWERIYQPTLALRGELSTLFPVRVADDMKTRKPNDKLTLETIAGAGHVPSLFRDDQIKIIADWLAVAAG